MQNNAPSAQVKFNLGLVPQKDRAEIRAFVKNYPAFIEYLLRALVENPRRIYRNYSGTVYELPDYHTPDSPYSLFVSGVNGSVLPESWGERRERGKTIDTKSDIFDVVKIIRGLWGEKDFPLIYRIVEALYRDFKRLPVPTEEAIRENALRFVRRRKELFCPYFAPFFGSSIRKAPTAGKLWKTLPSKIRLEEFGGSFRAFRDFLLELALEDPTEEFFEVTEHSYSTGNRNSRFTLNEKTGKSTSQRTVKPH